MKRAWIIGNGPSLNETPLDLLRGEISFGMNGIWRIYKQVRWRPTHYYMVDFNTSVPREEWETGIRIHQEMGIPMWLSTVYRDGFPEGHPNHKDMPEGMKDLKNVHWVKDCKHKPYHAGNSHGSQAWHLPEICTGYNHISGVMQVAVMEGFGPLYLLGCDLNYFSDPRMNHFDPDYNPFDTRDLAVQLQADAEEAHRITHNSAPVPIFNCSYSRGLGEYPFRNMRTVLAAKKKKW